jgi:O-methyltransferase involved in polyketide biosynthesis
MAGNSDQSRTESIGTDAVTDKHTARLGAVQQTLFIPLAARAHESIHGHPVFRDTKAVELVESIGYDTKYATVPDSWATVLRTAIFDTFVRKFLAEHPAGTVVELGTGLNTRFERVDNGQVHWIDLDLPDTIELRRAYFSDTDRRRTVAASILDEDWLSIVAQSPGPYFFASEGVFVYFEPEQVSQVLARIARRFPGSFIALDTVAQQMVERQRQMAAARDVAPMAWSCDEPRSLERLGLRVVESATVTRPPRALRRRLPARYRYLVPFTHRHLGTSGRFTVFRA